MRPELVLEVSSLWPCHPQATLFHLSAFVMLFPCIIILKSYCDSRAFLRKQN